MMDSLLEQNLPLWQTKVLDLSVRNAESEDEPNRGTFDAPLASPV
jgi:hypothetical protein